MLHLPMLKLKGYRCVGEGDILKIYITPSLEGSNHLVEKLDNSKPLMSVDLSQLVRENEEDYKTSPK